MNSKWFRSHCTDMHIYINVYCYCVFLFYHEINQNNQTSAGKCYEENETSKDKHQEDDQQLNLKPHHQSKKYLVNKLKTKQIENLYVGT